MGKVPTTNLNALARLAHENAVAHGFYDRPVTFAEQVALAHSELSEALEEMRDGHGVNETYFKGDKPCGVPTELADAILRVLDICGCHGIDIEAAVGDKMRYNASRPYRHGGKVA